MIDLQQFQSKNVLIIGDIMLDSFWDTRVTGKSPEANVDIWKLNKVVDSPGGAGNVAWNIKSLKNNPILLGVIGHDTTGKKLLRILDNLAINTNYILEEEGRVTTQKIRVHKDGSLQHRIDQEQTDAIDDAIQKELLESLDEILEHQKIDVAILQDYNKGVLFEDNIPEIISKLKDRSVPIVVDPKYNNFTVYQKVDLFKPNWKEFCAHANISNHEQLLEASQIFAKDTGIKNILITLSEEGAFYWNNDNNGIADTKAIKDADVCGAGDTVVSISALGIANAWSISEIAKFSNLCGGIVCMKKGVKPISIADLIMPN